MRVFSWPMVLCGVVVLCLACLSVTSQADLITHDFDWTIERNGVSNAWQWGAFPKDWTLPLMSDGTTSPLYEGTTIEGNNPLYDPTAPVNDPGGPAVSIERAEVRVDKFNVRQEFGPTQAQRTMTVTITLYTNDGLYRTALDTPVDFIALDEPLNYAVGPIRWMAPEAITTRLVDPNTGDPVIGDELVIAQYSMFTATVVPEPASVCLLGAIGLVMARRRMV